MSRPIKFRIYNKLRKSFNNSCNYSATEHDPITEYYDSPADCLSQVLSDCQKDDNLVIQQFTGVLDKNGKEIYEGDIVEIWENSNQRIIQWANKWGMFITYNGDLEIAYKNESPIDIMLSSGLFKIIGNIFKNPKLK